MRILPVVLACFALFAGARTAAAQDARVCRESRNNNEGLAACNAALAQTQSESSTEGELYFNRGLRHFALKQYPEAIDDFTKAIPLAPERSLNPAYTNRGLAYMGEKKNDLALADLTKAVELNPNAFPSLIDRASLETDMGQFSAASADTDRAIQLNPESFVALAAGCAARSLSSDNLDMALDDCDRAMKINSYFVPVLTNRGLIYWRRGDYGDAISDENSALALKPRSAEALYVRSLAKAKSGDAAGSKADFEAAKSITPDIVQRYTRWSITPDTQPVH